MSESPGETVVYRNKLIKIFRMTVIFPSFEEGFYASIGSIGGEVESYISRSDTADEALRAAKAAIDAQSLILL